MPNINLDAIRERAETAWLPQESDMPESLCAAKRVNVIHCDDLGDWFVGHGKNEDCQIEGTAAHWHWLAYVILGLVDAADCPYSEQKPLPFHKDILADIPALLAEVERLRGLVEKGYREGYGDGYNDSDNCRREGENNKWLASDARKAVENAT